MKKYWLIIYKDWSYNKIYGTEEEARAFGEANKKQHGGSYKIKDYSSSYLHETFEEEFENDDYVNIEPSMFISMLVGEEADDVLYMGYDKEKALEIIHDYLDDVDRNTLRTNRTTPKLLVYVGDKDRTFDRLVRAFRRMEVNYGDDLYPIGWTNWRDLERGKLRDFKIIYEY